MTSLSDYSKWRNFGDEDSDDERPRGMPRVTRLDGTQSITIGPPPATRTATSVRADEVNAKPAGSKRPADALDYSRWDQLQVDDSDGDDDDNEYDGYGNVIPKHLLTPKGDAGDDFTAHAAKYGAEPYRGPYHGPEHAEDDGGEEEEALTAEEMATLRARVAAQTAEREAVKPPPPTPEETAAALAEAAAARRAALTAKLTRNGAARETHLWRQARAIRRAIRRAYSTQFSVKAVRVCNPLTRAPHRVATDGARSRALAPHPAGHQGARAQAEIARRRPPRRRESADASRRADGGGGRRWRGDVGALRGEARVPGGGAEGGRRSPRRDQLGGQRL